MASIKFVSQTGVGSDLVCVGEQPLHAVPLLQFHNKRHSAASNDFSMPHWINLSFYSSSKRIGYSTFLPRIKMAPILNKETTLHKSKTAGIVIQTLLLNKSRNITLIKLHRLYLGLLSSKTSSSIKVESSLPNSVFDYDAYDAKVFALPVTRTSKVFEYVMSWENNRIQMFCYVQVQTLMRETRHRKTTTSEVNRFDRSRGNARRSRLHDMDISFTTGHPGI
jgi:hypothetical protein